LTSELFSKAVDSLYDIQESFRVLTRLHEAVLRDIPNVEDLKTFHKERIRLNLDQVRKLSEQLQ